jgi:hypothetical protein
MYISTKEGFEVIVAEREDNYDLDIMLAKIIITGLQGFRDRAGRHIPLDIVKKYNFKEWYYYSGQMAFDFMDNPEEDEVANAMAVKEWERIIDKIIDAFKRISIGGDTFDENGEIEEGLELFAKYFRNFWC